MEKFYIRSETQTRFEGDKKYIRGLIPYNSMSHDLGGFREVISNTAFNKTLADGKNVRALLDHKTDKILGDVRSKTLKLESTTEGLIAEVEVPNVSYAQDAYSLLERGIGQGISFGFYPVKYDDSKGVRTLREVKLEEVSFLVSVDPAYPESKTQTYKRSLSEITEELKAIEIKDEEKESVLKTLNEIIQKLSPAEKVEDKEVINDTSEVDSLLLEMDIALQL